MSDINRKNKQFSAKGLAECALFVVLMIVTSYIRIPIPYVPLTFQTVTAILAGLLLGPKRGVCSMFIYIFMGLMGLPVFSGGGGFSYVLKLTFGYILGFAAAAFTAGALQGEGALCLRRSIIAALFAVAANYLIGVPYFAMIWKFYMNMDGVWQSVLLNNLLYLPKDLLLACLAAIVAERAAKVLRSRAR